MELATNTGKQFQAKFVIAAVGCLSNTNIPNIKGLDSFEVIALDDGSTDATATSSPEVVNVG